MDQTISHINPEMILRNGVILGCLTFVLGAMGGWAISTAVRGLGPALAGLAVSVLLASISVRIYWRTRGTL